MVLQGRLAPGNPDTVRFASRIFKVSSLSKNLPFWPYKQIYHGTFNAEKSQMLLLQDHQFHANVTKGWLISVSPKFMG